MSATLAHGGLREGINRIALLTLFEELGKRGLRLSSTATRLLQHYIWRSRDDDYRPGRICAVWERVCRTAEALELSSRAVNNAERELEAKGLIVRTTGGNGSRSGLRIAGVIRWAAGINLAPVIERYADLKDEQEARLLHRAAFGACQAEIRTINRAIRKGAVPYIMKRADALLPDGRVAHINDIKKLEAIRDALQACLRNSSAQLV